MLWGGGCGNGGAYCEERATIGGAETFLEFWSLERKVACDDVTFNVALFYDCNVPVGELYDVFYAKFSAREIVNECGGGVEVTVFLQFLYVESAAKGFEGTRF